jgi:BirA family biotin operon repressor/biotin-[acetyl-CoA-carboxylase] ligase
VAEVQTAGRGRAGRSWLSEPGASLTFSIAWPFHQTPQALLGLPLAIGVALATALQSVDVPVQLKWPNDVLKDSKKLAGVLVETATHGTTTWAVIGIGLNLLMPVALETRIGHAVADATWLAQMDRNQLLGILLSHQADCLQQFSSAGLTPFVEPWNALHAYLAQHVNLIDHGVIVRKGIALGINASGCLLLQDESGAVHPIMVGDVSLRTE